MTKALYVPLSDGDLRLEPLDERYRAGLRDATSADQEIWAIYPVDYAGEAFGPQFDQLLAGPPQRCAYAIVLDGTVAGMTAWIERGAPGWSIEIGNSFIRPDLRGSGLNSRVKCLMLDHAFACGLRRVEFRVDIRNVRSRAAVLRLGAVQEGVLRAERITWSGHVRDTAVFSILSEEWRAHPD